MHYLVTTHPEKTLLNVIWISCFNPKVTEDIVIKLAKGIAKETGERNLCLAGGVALNCVANGILFRKKIFDRIWIQPASGDAGGALGAALSIWHLHYNNQRIISKNHDAMRGGYLGPEYSNTEIESELEACGAIFKKYSENEMIEKVAEALVQEKVIGWMKDAWNLDREHWVDEV